MTNKLFDKALKAKVLIIIIKKIYTLKENKINKYTYLLLRNFHEKFTNRYPSLLSCPRLLLPCPFHSPR